MWVFYIQVEFANGTLKLENTQKPDQGKYTCVVSNSAGTAEADVYLSVLGKFVN